MPKFIVFHVIIGLTFCFATVLHSNAQTDITTSELLEKKVSLKLLDIDEELFLRVVSRRYQVPIGFYQTFGQENQRKSNRISVTVKSKTLRSILEQFVKRDSRYKWTVVNDVINIVPKSQETLLEIPVSKIDLREISLDEAELYIFAVPDIVRSFESQRLRTSKINISYGFVPNRPRFSLTMEKSTLGRILNQMLKDKNCGYWNIKRSGPNSGVVVLSLE